MVDAALSRLLGLKVTKDRKGRATNKQMLSDGLLRERIRKVLNRTTPNHFTRSDPTVTLRMAPQTVPDQNRSGAETAT